MADQIFKGRFEGLEIAFVHGVTTEMVNQIIVMHDCDPAGAHLLGRSLTAGVMAAALLPENQRMNVSWRYPGALKAIVVDAGQDGSVRGMISPSQLGALAENNAALFGDVGELQVVTTVDGKILNSGSTPVALHDPVNDFSYHYSISDQIETELSALIGFQRSAEVPVILSQGWMIQALPACDLEQFDRIRRKMEKPFFRRLTQEPAAADDGFARVVEVLVGQESGYTGLEVERAQAPFFACTCSREKMADVVRSIPVPERMNMVRRDEDVHINCQFCSSKYRLTIADCINAWNNKPMD